MRVRVLGPLEISDGGEPRRVGAAKQRALLAALVVRAGRPVPVDRLIEEMWGGRTPATAVNLVQGYVAALRRVLGDREGVLLRTRPPGYQLVLPDDEVDLRYFEVLVERGRTARADGDSQTAWDLLTEAEGLWRGQPFTDIPATAAVEAEANRLEQLRLAAVEARVDADLDLGRHVRLVPELQTLVAAHPLLERFWVQLMLALYRSGRQAEALAAYQRLYTLLDDELGVEPSRPVRELHHQILNREAALDTLADKPIRTGNVVPRQLPAGTTGFAGRQEQLAQLDALLDAQLPLDETSPALAVVISAITGTAGIGKTALAVYWAHRVAERFPDGQLYVNLRGFDPIAQPVSASDAVRGFLDALGVAPERIPIELEAQAALYRSLLAERRMLVVLDNARDTDQVRPLLPGSLGCLALVTSRNQLESLVVAEAARPVAIDLLSVEEADDLLAARLGKGRVAAEPEAAEAVITACARLPLALAIVAARAATHPHLPLAVLATQVGAARTSLQPFTSGDPTTDLRAVFSWSYDQLDPDTRRLFRLLGLHPGPDITPPAAASLAGRPLTHVGRALAELCRAHMLTEHLPGRHTFHDLLRTYAIELTNSVDTQEDRNAAAHRLLDHYLHTTYAADRLLHPARDPQPPAPFRPGVTPEPLNDYGEAMAWLTNEHAVLLGCVSQAAATGFDVHAWQLVWALETSLIWRGRRQDRAAAAGTALEAIVRLGDKPGQARILRLLALAEVDIGRLDAADTHLRHALELSAGLGDLIGQAHSHSYLGRVCERQSRYADALDHAYRALILHQSAGHRRGEANALTAVGWYQAHLGRYDQALDSCAQALAMHEELGNRHEQADTWDSLGYTHYRLGHHSDTIACYQQATLLYREVGNRYEEAETLVSLGQAIHATGDLDAARATWQQALTILDELDHPDAETVRTKVAKLPPPTRVAREEDRSIGSACAAQPGE